MSESTSKPPPSGKQRYYVQRICLQCHSSFAAEAHRSPKYCSLRCSGKSRRKSVAPATATVAPLDFASTQPRRWRRGPSVTPPTQDEVSAAVAEYLSRGGRVTRLSPSHRSEIPSELETSSEIAEHEFQERLSLHRFKD